MTTDSPMLSLLCRLLSERNHLSAEDIHADTLLTDALRSDADWAALSKALYRNLTVFIPVETLQASETVGDLAQTIDGIMAPEASAPPSEEEPPPCAAPAPAPPAADHDNLRAKAESGQGYTTVTVFYATDRERGDDSQGFQDYGPRRGEDQLVLGSAEVTIPSDHRYGELEGPKWWQFFRSPDRKKHILVQSAQELADAVFWTNVRYCVAESSDRDILILVHGYNVSFENGLRRAAQFVRDLEFPGAPILYSWPSCGSVEGYAADEESIRWTVPHLRDFLKSTLESTGAERVHVVAHSMGNRAVVDAIRELDLAALAPDAASLRQLVLAAPDIDAALFRRFAAEFASKVERCTLYVNSEDKALALSEKLHGGYPRAGEGGDDLLVMPGIDTIDASHHATDFLSHSYFAGSSPVISDLFAIIRNEDPPQRRSRLRRNRRAGLVYWSIAV